MSSTSVFPRIMAALATLALALTGGISTAAAQSPITSSSTDDRGLFGEQDPSFDGVYRQSLSLLGLSSVGRQVPRAAVTWLVDQQCPNGSFASYRADTLAPCPPADPNSFTGPDSNSTALAALALMQVDRVREARRAMRWLVDQQRSDGGWAYLAGLDSDASSTGLALAAMRTADIPRARVTKAPARAFISTLIAGCDAPAGQRFGVGFQAGSPVDSFSSVHALLGLTGSLPVAAHKQYRGGPRVTCNAQGSPTKVPAAVSRWVISQFNANDGSIPSSFVPGETDWNSTALGIIGLVSSKFGGNATDIALSTLAANIDAYVVSSGDRPAALGTTLLVTTATDSDPRDFGGSDLIQRLIDSMRR